MTLTKPPTKVGTAAAVPPPSDFVDLISIGLALYESADGLNEYANSAFATLHGYRPLELKEITSEALVSEFDRQEWRTSLQEALSTGIGFSLDIDRVRKDGSTFLSFVRVTPNPVGAYGRYLLEVHDRDEQGSLTKALNEERGLLLASFQQLPIAVLVLSADSNRVLSQSGAFCNMFPNPTKITQSDFDKAHRAISLRVRKGVEGQVRMSAQDIGMTVDIELKWTPVVDYSGRVVAVTVVITPA